MPYTFGAGATNRVSHTLPIPIGPTARTSLVCGWWRPTTLTSTRGLWSAGSIYGAEINTTTDELRLRTDNTTDGQWTTTGVDLAVNEWKFLAFMLSCLNGTPSAAWRVWAGSIETAPQPVTVTLATTPVGNFGTSGAGTFYIGNKATGSLAFQGDIADVTTISSLQPIGAPHIFGQAAHGAITDAEALWVYETMVLPIWLGDIASQFDLLGKYHSINSTSITHCSLDELAVVRHNSDTATTVEALPSTITGATPSLNGAPRPNVGPDMLRRPRR